MSNFAWSGLQFVITMAVFAFLRLEVGTSAEPKPQGAEVVISLGVAFAVTWLISKIIDWRNARSLRRLDVSKEPESNAGSRIGLSRHPSDSAKLISRPRIGQDRR